MRRTKVGVVQVTSGPEVEPNLRAVERAVRGAAGDGAELVVVPESFAYLGPEEGQRRVAEPLPEGGPVLARCRALAQERNVELVLGGFWERAAGGAKVKNACLHLRSDGTVAAIYRKIHLFDVDLPDGTRLLESEHVEPGRELVVTDAPFGVLGLSVCYDLRFPELYRGLVDRGAVALAVPSAFTLTTGKDHWHVLLRARAIEQQCYVLAAAQAGHHWGRRVSYGHALIVDPWGTVVAECADGEGWATAWLEPERVQRVRRQVPSLQHRVLK
ncbi:MAG: carbon-nitrogen hydrolase family protein [Myxococcota bacterium]